MIAQNPRAWIGDRVVRIMVDCPKLRCGKPAPLRSPLQAIRNGWTTVDCDFCLWHSQVEVDAATIELCRRHFMEAP